VAASTTGALDISRSDGEKRHYQLEL